jgi:hypothetical protein
MDRRIAFEIIKKSIPRQRLTLYAALVGDPGEEGTEPSDDAAA